MITTTDPRTGLRAETELDATSREEVARIVEEAAAAFSSPFWRDRSWRADLLDGIADGLERSQAELVETAVRETGLSRARLEGELARSAYQFRLFADAVREGSYLEATIDHAADTPIGPGPDLRRMLVPLGPVAVFGSSNFPFAFSVPGGDTASALAAGNPVILKAHGSHPETAWRSFTVLRDAVSSAGAPIGSVGIVFGQRAGADLVAHPAVRAVGFTGSLSTGRILMDIIAQRQRPIPFYGELSSVNPLIVTPGAAQERAEAIADGLVAAVTGSAGQLCTKPGVAFLPQSATALIDSIAARIEAQPAHIALNERIAEAFGEISDRLVEEGHGEIVAHGAQGNEGFPVTATVLSIPVADMTPAIGEEAFGPLVVLALYDDIDQLDAALDTIPDSLAAGIHSLESEDELRRRLVRLVEDRVGRIVFDGYPTGVRVAWAQHHGGPWPATNTQHTSVGMTAMRRFLRPLVLQDAPADLLPAELADGEAIVPRRVDGRLELPPSYA